MKKGKLLVLFSSLCLILLLVPSLFAQEPEIPYAGEVPLTPNVRPVIILSGSDYNIGYQWYQQIVQIYGRKPCEELSHQKFTQEEIAALKTYQWYIKKYVPEMIDMLHGMVAGANDTGISLSYEQVLAKWSGTMLYPVPPGSENEKLLPEEDCSGWAAWGSMTKDGKLYCGGSGDHQIIMGENEIRSFEYCVVVFPEKGNNFVFSTSTGCCWHPGMNNKGVAMFHHGATGYFNRYKEPEEQNYGYGVPNTMITMHTLRFSNTADEAQDLILSLPSGDGRVGGAWADVNGSAFVIENRDNPRCIRKPGDYGENDFIYATNNLFSNELGSCYKSSPGLPVVYIPHAGWLGTYSSRESIPRNLGMWNLFHNYSGEVDLKFARMMWRFPGEPLPYATIEEAVADFDKTQGKYWNSKICETGNAMVGILVPDDGDEGLYYVSQGCAARVSMPHWTGLLFVRIAPTYSFYQLKLDSSMEKLTEAARTRAQFDLYNAYQELRKLTYWDVPYAPLDELLNQAATEWQKGEHYQKFANKTEGNESTNYVAKAARAYTRCQALSKQVYNSLVPPPTCPEDIGLRPWFGAWGEWAIRGDN